MMLEIKYNDKKYEIDKTKLKFVLKKLTNRDDIEDSELLKLIEKYELFDECFLETINKI